MIAYAVAAVAAYLLGSIPTGFLVARARGIDIRTVGSGNIGATNVFRTLGKAAGSLVLLADAAKGFLACWLVAGLASRLAAPSEIVDGLLRERLKMVAGIVAILGHNYPCWLRFKGGKGVATTGGVLLALFPQAFALGLVTWVSTLALTRYVSIASMAAGVALPVGVWVFHGSGTLIAVAGGLAALAIYKHRGNIQRLRLGTELRVGSKKTPNRST
jgi:acyl phosphate:glycerol-3-phosphate acyltransferase